MLTIDDQPLPRCDPEVESWSYFSDLLAALVEATHPTKAPSLAFSETLDRFIKLAEAHAGAALIHDQQIEPSPLSPLSDPGIRNLIAGLLDVASYTPGTGQEFRELRELFQSFESVAKTGIEPSPG
jgi:hypothetical protein